MRELSRLVFELYVNYSTVRIFCETTCDVTIIGFILRPHSYFPTRSDRQPFSFFTFVTLFLAAESWGFDNPDTVSLIHRIGSPPSGWHPTTIPGGTLAKSRPDKKSSRYTQLLKMLFFAFPNRQKLSLPSSAKTPASSRVRTPRASTTPSVYVLATPHTVMRSLLCLLTQETWILPAAVLRFCTRLFYMFR